MTRPDERCGSWRVTRYIEGNAADARWCERTDGPCPFAGTDQQSGTERRCATEPGTTLRIQWADSAIDDAYTALKRYQEGPCSAPPRQSQDLAVAIDALRACGGEEPTCDGTHAWLHSCPAHGRCSCPSEQAAPYNPSCPLHGSSAAPPKRAASGEAT